MRQCRRGQSLVEVLLAISIGAVLITAGVALVAPAVQANKQAAKVQTASSLGKQLLDNVRVWSESNWNYLLSSIATGTNYHYYLNTSSSPFILVTTTSSQPIIIGTSTYTRYFYIMDVYRNGGSIVPNGTPGASYDPSTKQVTVVYGLPSVVPTDTMSTYVVRGRNYVFSQRNWSGGVGSSTNSQFTSSSNINYQLSPGSICINNLLCY